MARKKRTKAAAPLAEAAETLPTRPDEAPSSVDGSTDAGDAALTSVAGDGAPEVAEAAAVDDTRPAGAPDAAAAREQAPRGLDEVVEAPAAPTAPSKVVDKRRLARLFGFGGGESAGARPADMGVSDARIAELQERVDRARAEARADAEATRTRLERHFETRVTAARAEVVEAMLPVLDNLERALAVPGAQESVIYEGVAATRDLFVKRLGELGAEPVPSIGERFDPTSHEAIDEVAVDDPAHAGSVVEEVRRGFRIGDRLVRPAMVRVGKAAQTAPDGESD